MKEAISLNFDCFLVPTRVLEERFPAFFHFLGLKLCGYHLIIELKSWSGHLAQYLPIFYYDSSLENPLLGIFHTFLDFEKILKFVWKISLGFSVELSLFCSEFVWADFLPRMWCGIGYLANF